MIGLVCRAVDLAIWLWTILFRGEAYRPYNVGSDQEITISRLARIVLSKLTRSVVGSTTKSDLFPSGTFRLLSALCRNWNWKYRSA